jgi:cobalt/nickel transport protein
MEKQHIAMVIAVIIILTIPFFLYQGKLGEQGTDDQASQAIEQTGYQPWFSSLWTPPSGEVESLLFALQAVVGVLILGYFLGYYWRKQKAK